MDTSPAVAEADLWFGTRGPDTIDMQAFNAFWRQEGDIYICLFACSKANFYNTFEPTIMVLTFSFTPQMRSFEHKYTVSLRLDGEQHSPRIISSQTGRIAVWGMSGVYGSDIHRIIQNGPNDRLCRKVLPNEIPRDYGMDPYSGAILQMTWRSTSTTEVVISYFD
ncbi:hypothetical protein DFH11DRAFT_1632645 [Phellopilus nigrolimitatus]|nr:hypothetical protein DFH11DRAFT_1632645 [Phellopilus nigrolimitatus]